MSAILPHRILPSVTLMEADEPAEPRRRRRRQLLADSGAVHGGAQISLRIALEKAASGARRQSQARGYMKGLFGCSLAKESCHVLRGCSA